MKYWASILVGIFMVLALNMPSRAQDDYVICQSMDGTQSMFNGYCPAGWFFVRYVL